MSDNQESLKDWLIKNYPTEAVFVDEINKTVNDIYQHLRPQPNLIEGKPRDMKFQIVKRPETDYLELTMSSDAVLFLAGIARGIANVILSELVPNLMPETKECIYCKTTNNRIAKYCIQCGEMFS